MKMDLALINLQWLLYDKTKQNQSIGTNYIQAKIAHMQPNCKCRLCGDGDETLNKITECSQLRKGIRTIGNYRKNRNHPNYSIVEIGQNTLNNY